MKSSISCLLVLILIILVSGISLTTSIFRTYQSIHPFISDDLQESTNLNTGLINQKMNPTSQELNFNELKIYNTLYDTYGITSNITVNGDSFGGYNLFVLRQLNRTTMKTQKNLLLIMDMNGTIVLNRSLSLSGFTANYAAKFINSTTLLYSDAGNVFLWNIYTNETTLIGYDGHHDIEYNPINQTYFFLSKKFVEINGTTYSYDVIVELKKWQKIWALPTDTFIPHTQWGPFKEMEWGNADITHANSIFFDTEEDILYLNIRNQDTFYKIDHKTGQILWGLGRKGNFTLYDKKGVQRSSLFYHAHAVEKVDENTFILFDNDIYNITNPQNERSRLVEITIDETTMTANESWSWTAPSDYYSRALGDADCLPNGNRLGTFGTHTHPDTNVGARLVEVNETGHIVWEMNFPNTDDYLYEIYRAERFRYSPILSSPRDLKRISENNVTINWQAWYNFRNKVRINGSYALYLNTSLVTNGSLTFNTFWRSTTLESNLGRLKTGIYNLTLVVADEAGHKTVNSVNISGVSFYLDREGPLEIELGQDNSMICWEGNTCSPLLANLTINTSLLSSFVWNGQDITLDLNSLKAGYNLVTLQLFNNTKLVKNDSFEVRIHSPLPPTIDFFPPDQTVPWYDSVTFSWSLFDCSPFSWKITINNSLKTSGSWRNQILLLNWTLPVLNEGVYNITLIAYDLAHQQTSVTTGLTVVSPSPPVIVPVLMQTEFQWGQANASLTWEVHGGTQWLLWKNGTVLRSGTCSNQFITILIEHWQLERWGLGRYNVTLQVFDEKGASASSTRIIWIWLNLGDMYADAIILGSSLWYIFGEEALGAPNGAFAKIFLDYGNGYLTLDMGNGEEIINGNGMDFTIIAQGGDYSVYIINDLDSIPTYLGWSNGNTSFDLTTVGVSIARYIRIEYRSGATVELDAIVASHYNEPADTNPPQIKGLVDFWIWENQATVTLTWEVFDVTPWTYSLWVDGILIEDGPWNGSDIFFTFSVRNSNGQIQVTLVLFDIFENRAEDTVNIEIHSLDSTSTGFSISTTTTPLPSPVFFFAVFFFLVLKRRKSARG